MLPRPPTSTLFPYTTLFRSFLPQREDPLDATVVELDALPDPDRAAPHDEHLPTRQFLRLPAGLVGRVEVWRLGLELASAGVDHLVDDPGPRATDRELGAARERGNRFVREPEPLRFRYAGRVLRGFPQRGLHPDQPADFLDEKRIPSRQGGDLLRREIPSHGLRVRELTRVGRFS